MIADKTLLDPAFARDKFLLRQKHLSISQKYYVWDEEEQVILFIERPSHFLQTLGAALVGIILGIAAAIALDIISSFILLGIDSYFLIFLDFCIALIVAFVVMIVLSPKRHVNIYRDESKTEQLLEIQQESKWQFPYAYYQIKDARGMKLARLQKNYFYDLIRKRWYCYLNDGSLLCTIKEDSVVMAILRRFFGSFYGLLRTNFVILAGRRERLVGTFNRKCTLLDRYVLDMSDDPERVIDRRIAVAIGIMLDTGERR